MEEIENSKEALRNKIRDIRTVCEWAEEMGYEDPKYFARVFRSKYGVGPKEALVKIRINRWIECILQDPEQKNYSSAREVGLKDEVALNKYLKQYTGKTPTQLKKEIIKGVLTVDKWKMHAKSR
jgi:AraC-like DNA-binding protein